MNDDGQWINFHALRTSAATWLAAAGVPDSVAAKITGHRTLDTLHKHYHRASAEELHEAVESLPILLATGTDDARPGSDQVTADMRANVHANVHANFVQTGGDSMQRHATGPPSRFG